MQITKWLALGLVCAVSLAAQGPRGTVPRAAADKYAAHGEVHGTAVGARLLTAKEAAKVFSTDVDRCCMVLEVAFFPAKDGMADVVMNEFALRVVGEDIANRPATAELVAARLYRKSQPASSGGRDVYIQPRVGVGYETGTDPYTGQRRSGTTTTTGVDVIVGPKGSGPGGPGAGTANPPYGEEDRRTMELELREKGLPEGATAAPVSGYIYFSQLKKKNAKYQLEYTVNGEKVVMAF
jgi:hypothetical protein